MRYFLHVVQTHQTVRDPEGSEHANLTDACAEAVEGARQMMATAVLSGRDISDWRIEITDDRDALMGNVAFASVITREPLRAA